MTADASLRFSGTQDRMKVGVARYEPPRDGGRPLTMELIQQLLRTAGVQVPLSRKGAEKLLENIASGEPLDRIVIARGVLPENGTDAYIVPYGNFMHPIFPGQSLGSKVAAVQPKSGMRVDGSEVPPQSPHKPRDIQIAEDSLCMQAEGSTDIIARAYGLVQVSDTAIKVKPLTRISDDALEVIGSVYHTDVAGNRIDADRISLMLQAMKVPAEMIALDAIAAALAQCEATGNMSDEFVLARGYAAVDGKDGFVDLMQPEDESAHVGTTSANGAIDFRNRGVIPSVRAGELVAVIHPPILGTPGRDVQGNVIPARSGQEIKAVLDSSVVLSGDGKSVIAQRDGLSQFSGGIISVQETVEVKGDVDYTSGNVHVASGAVRVKGSVLSGFSIKAPGSLVVGEVIESAQIVVGGSVEVAGGIVMKENGFVRCGGSVLASYINEATIEAREDVIVRDSLSNSTIQCGGKVVAVTGRGRIQGGSILCRGGVQALEVGSELGVATQITLVASSKALRDLEKERDSVKDALAKIAMKFGEGSEEDILMHANPEQYKAIEMAMALRETLTVKLAGLREQVAAAKESAAKKLHGKTVSVMGTVHGGTTIKIGEAVFLVSHPLQAAVFRFVPESGVIEVTSAV